MPHDPDILETLFFSTPQEFSDWLAVNHATTPQGVWIRMARKNTGIQSIDHPAAILVALCWGWIDGQRAKSTDAEYFRQKFTPRRARSKWSQINVGHAERLIAEGRMQPAGYAEIERAKADGRWDAAYASPRTIAVPDDFAAALEAEPAARAFFETLSGSKRYSFLYRILDAKRPETRARRISEYVARLARGETFH